MNTTIGVIGLSALLGVLKGQSGSSGTMPPEDELLHQHFAIGMNQKIPMSYLKNELERLSTMPEHMRTEYQDKIIECIQRKIDQK